MNIESIKQKIKVITESITEMEPILKFSSSQIISDNLKLRSMERLFQLIVDATVDINTEIIASNSFESPDSYQGTFYILQSMKVIKGDLVDKIAPSVGLRNRLIHRYETIKPRLSVDEIKRFIPYYIKYLKLISNYVKN